MPLILGTNSIKDTGYDVANSLRFNDGSSDALIRTLADPGGAGNRNKWTFSTWMKRGQLGTLQTIFGSYQNSNYHTLIQFNTSDQLDFFDEYNGSKNGQRTTNRRFTDPSAWLHLVFIWDKDNSTTSEKMRIYVNGVEETNFATSSAPSNATTLNADGQDISIGQQEGVGNYFDGYLCETVFNDGQAYTADNYGEFDSDTPTVWKPIDVSGLTFGTNGFYLDFENSSSLGADVSGNSNNFTVNNLTSIDQTTDTCTNNFCTLNPLINSGGVYSEANCKLDSGDDNKVVWGTMATSMNNSSAGWYYEVKIEHTPNTTNGYGIRCGCASIDFANTQSGGMGTDGGFGMSADTAKLIQNGASVNQLSQNGGANSINSSISTANGQIMNVAWKNGKTFYGVNGVYVANDGGSDGNPSSDTNQSYDIVSSVQGDFWNAVIASSGSTPYFDAAVGVNFGNPTFSISSGNADANGYGNFEYAPPTGFYAICSKNLAEYG